MNRENKRKLFAKRYYKDHASDTPFVCKNCEWAILHRCKNCGTIHSNRIAADDNPLKLMSLAMKPISSPPFPLDKIFDGDGELKF